jgi:hypothetical protein
MIDELLFVKNLLSDTNWFCALSQLLCRKQGTGRPTIHSMVISHWNIWITVSILTGCMDDFSAMDSPLHWLIPLRRSPNICINKDLENLCNTGSIPPVVCYVDVVRRSGSPDHRESYDRGIARS